jgi:hypothetical protein
MTTTNEGLKPVLYREEYEEGNERFARWQLEVMMGFGVPPAKKMDNGDRERFKADVRQFIEGWS